MSAPHGCRQVTTVLAALLVLPVAGQAGCGHVRNLAAEAEVVRGQDLGSLPYHPLVYHLDLSVLAYQLYAQTLAWPFDPYLEEQSRDPAARVAALAKVHAWAADVGRDQVARDVGLDGYRGPGVLAGFESNPRHDPVIYQYSRLHPWSHAVTNVSGVWTEYRTPKQITGAIRDVRVCYRATGAPAGTVAVDRVAPRRADAAPGARDVLLAFEGGTGDKGQGGQPASQSLMGFVLLRHHGPAGDGYDVHIAFRGSRSGSVTRAVGQSISDRQASGNPDWITDLGYDRIDRAAGAGPITTVGSVHRGFAASMTATLPQITRCLTEAAALAPAAAPRRIFVTGHSLGGGLAQHFTSAVLQGDVLGPSGRGPEMPDAVRGWPWSRVKLVSFSAPRAGDKTWARTLTVEGLASEFFSTRVDPVDRKAFRVTNPTILPRLTAADGPAGFRVLGSQDPVTSKALVGGKHVGKTIYVDAKEPAALVGKPDVDAHEPAVLRRLMTGQLADPRIPGKSWRYRPMTDLHPKRGAAAAGSADETAALVAAIRRYHADEGIWLDEDALEEAARIYSGLGF